MNMITLEQLKALRPCQEQWDIVVKEFPDGIPVTEQSMTKALGLKLDIDWLAENILPENLLAEYKRQEAPLRAEYRRQKASLRAEYESQIAPLWAEYKRQEAPILAEYESQIAPLWAEYKRQEAPLWAEYERQVAFVLLGLLLGM